MTIFAKCPNLNTNKSTHTKSFTEIKRQEKGLIISCSFPTKNIYILLKEKKHNMKKKDEGVWQKKVPIQNFTLEKKGVSKDMDLSTKPKHPLKLCTLIWKDNKFMHIDGTSGSGSGSGSVLH